MTGNVVPGDQGSKEQPGRLLGELGQVRGILGSLPVSPRVYLLSVTLCHLPGTYRTQLLSLLISCVTPLDLAGTQFQVSMKKNISLLSGVSPESLNIQ